MWIFIITCIKLEIILPLRHMPFFNLSLSQTLSTNLMITPRKSVFKLIDNWSRTLVSIHVYKSPKSWEKRRAEQQPQPTSKLSYTVKSGLSYFLHPFKVTQRHLISSPIQTLTSTRSCLSAWETLLWLACPVESRLRQGIRIKLSN